MRKKFIGKIKNPIAQLIERIIIMPVTWKQDQGIKRQEAAGMDKQL